MGDDVERGHAQAGAIAEDADVPSELHVGEALLFCHPLLWILGGEIAQLGELLVPVQRAVVDRDLGVQGDDLALGGDDQGVDLDQRRVLGERDVVKLHQELRHLLGRVLVDAGIDRDLAGRLCRQGLARLHVPPDERRGVGLGYLLDVHAAHAREYREQLLLGAVEDDRAVVLGVDSGGSLDPDLMDLEAADVHAEDGLGVTTRLVAIVRDLDPAGLAPLAGPHLRLYDAGIADLLGRLDGSLDAGGVAAVGHRHVVLGEQLLPLVLEQVHQGAALGEFGIGRGGSLSQGG